MSSLQNEATLRSPNEVRPRPKVASLRANQTVLQMDSIEEILTDEVYYSFVNIFSLIMLIFVTGVLGFHVLKKFKNPFTGKKFNEKKVDDIAKWILIVIWFLLLITECIRVNKKLKT